MCMFSYNIFLVQRPYRIPIPDWAAVLLAIPPTFGIIVIFLISNWYVWIFSIGVVVVSLGLHQCGTASKERGWCSYETKTAESPYEVTATEDRSTVDGTESSTTADVIESECNYNDIGVIQEENRIT